MFAKPKIGSDIEIVTTTPNPAQPFALPKRHRGTVVKPFNWVGDHDFCLTTGDSAFPVRVVDIRYVKEMKFIDGTEAVITETAVPKIRSWTVDGSKGNQYIVTNDDGKWSCDCVAGKFGRHCKHVEQLKRECI
jgi:hypothetical protein